MMRSLKIGAALCAAGVGGKVISICINDEAPEIKYAARKYFQPVSTDKQASPKPRVVVLGSGWAALSFIRTLDQDRVDLTLISPRSFFLFTPLLAGACTGAVSRAAIAESIRYYLHMDNTCRYIQLEG
ncbi:hypothetical protein B484DRAFT_390771 [Ochromonadaceae sp. CCMP2298]|nr:hypothetical protein B484DRAFT_390771 [Ochromonadaceae sp. CCMP2298]